MERAIKPQIARRRAEEERADTSLRRRVMTKSAAFKGDLQRAERAIQHSPSNSLEVARGLTRLSEQPGHLIALLLA